MIIIGRLIKYSVYEIYKLEQNNLSCINQDTNNLRVVTLITCDSNNDNYRTIVKAKEL